MFRALNMLYLFLQNVDREAPTIGYRPLPMLIVGLSFGCTVRPGGNLKISESSNYADTGQ